MLISTNCLAITFSSFQKTINCRSHLFNWSPHYAITPRRFQCGCRDWSSRVPANLAPIKDQATANRWTLLLPASAERVSCTRLWYSGARTLRVSSSAERDRWPSRTSRISGCSSPVTHVGETNRFLQVFDGIFLTDSNLMEFLIADQRIRYVPKRALNGLPVARSMLADAGTRLAESHKGLPP